MASKDFQDLMDLLFKKKLRIQKITVSPYSDGAGHSDISFVGSTDTFSSTEPDVVNYALHIHQTIDSDGNYELVAFKDLDQYFRETDFLFKDEQPKLNRAARDLAEGRYTLDFDPDELIEEFLLSSNRESNRFSKLKSEHSYIAAYCANAAAYALKQYEQVKAKTPGIESYHQAMDKVYMRAFRSDPNFVKNYIRRKTSNDFNLLNYMIQVKAITQHVELLKIIFARGGIHVDQGIHLLLESYRKSAESLAYWTGDS